MFQLNAEPGQRPQNAQVALLYWEAGLRAVERTSFAAQPLMSPAQRHSVPPYRTEIDAVKYIIFHKVVSLNAQSFLSCLSIMCF